MIVRLLQLVSFQLQVLRDVFDRMDRDGSGHIVKEELVAAIAIAVRARSHASRVQHTACEERGVEIEFCRAFGTCASFWGHL